MPLPEIVLVKPVPATGRVGIWRKQDLFKNIITALPGVIPTLPIVKIFVKIIQGNKKLIIFVLKSGQNGNRLHLKGMEKQKCLDTHYKRSKQQMAIIF